MAFIERCLICYAAIMAAGLAWTVLCDEVRAWLRRRAWRDKGR